MNNRSQSIIDQAVAAARAELNTPVPSEISAEWINAFSKKLFELTADECVTICNTLSFSPEGPTYEAKFQRELCGLAIKEKFGLMSAGPSSTK